MDKNQKGYPEKIMADFTQLKDFAEYFNHHMCDSFVKNKVCKNAYIARYQFQSKRVRKFKQIFL